MIERIPIPKGEECFLGRHGCQPLGRLSLSVAPSAAFLTQGSAICHFLSAETATHTITINKTFWTDETPPVQARSSRNHRSRSAALIDSRVVNFFFETRAPFVISPIHDVHFFLLLIKASLPDQRALVICVELSTYRRRRRRHQVGFHCTTRPGCGKRTPPSPSPAFNFQLVDLVPHHLLRPAPAQGVTPRTDLPRVREKKRRASPREVLGAKRGVI